MPEEYIQEEEQMTDIVKAVVSWTAAKMKKLLSKIKNFFLTSEADFIAKIEAPWREREAELMAKLDKLLKKNNKSKKIIKTAKKTNAKNQGLRSKKRI
jgi:hypothetical protein